MSAFERLPKEYRAACVATAKNSPWRIVGHRRVPLSPGNRRVRLGTDLFLASKKQFPNTMTRQQRRAAERERMKRTKR